MHTPKFCLFCMANFLKQMKTLATVLISDMIVNRTGVPYDQGVKALTPQIFKRPKFDPKGFSWRMKYFKNISAENW